LRIAAIGVGDDVLAPDDLGEPRAATTPGCSTTLVSWLMTAGISVCPRELDDLPRLPAMSPTPHVIADAVGWQVFDGVFDDIATASAEGL